MNRSVRTLVGILVGLVVIVAVGAGLVWWKIAQLKERLQTQLGASIGAQVQVASLSLDVWKRELHASGITLVNQRSEQPWEKGDISQATVRFQLRELFSRDLELSIDVDSWNLKLHSPLRTAETPPNSEPFVDPAAQAGDGASGSGKGNIRVTHITAQGGTVEVDFSDDRKVVARGISFDAVDEGGGIWTTQLKSTSITAETLEAGVSSVQIRGDHDKITFSDLRMAVGMGIITGDGEVALHDLHDLKFNLKSVDVPITMLVAVKWQMQLSGLVQGDLVYTGNDKSGEAKGSLSVNHGKFNILPWLGKVTTMVGLPDISNVEVDKATSDVDWKDGTLHLTNIDVRKNDVSRIVGTVDVDAASNVDGHLKLGLPSTVTAKWPQVQTQVFTVSLEDYNWAEIHLTGTPDHLQEDLTPRLVQAGLGQGGDLLNSAAQKATDLFHSILGK